MKKFLDRRKSVLIVCMLFYIAVSAFFVIMSYGVYSVDEFYSLSSADLNFDTVYSRSVYMNGLVRLFSALFGRSYYVFRMIPEIAGAVSFMCALYLMTKFCKKNSSILIGSIAITLNSLVLFNHIYIRHYVFQEMVYMIGMVLIYQYTKEQRKWRYLYIAVYMLVAVLYFLFTGDASAATLMMIGLVMCLMAILEKKLPKILSNKYFWIGISICWIVLEIGVILLKKNMIDCSNNSILSEILHVLSFYQTDQFTFFLFLILVYSAVIIAILYLLYKIVQERFGNTVILYMVMYVGLPILAYFSFFFNNNLLRSFIPYISAGIVLLALFYDSISDKKKILVVLLVLVNTVFSYYPFPQGLIDFWSDPRIGEEIYSRDYQTWLDEARLAEEDGYTLVPMLTLIHEEHYFDVVSDLSLTILDETNNVIHEDDELLTALDQLIESGEKYVLIVDPLGRDALIRIGKFEYLKEKYRHTLYDDRLYEAGLSVFYIE